MKDTLRYVIEQSPNLVSNYELSLQLDLILTLQVLFFAGIGIMITLISSQIDKK